MGKTGTRSESNETRSGEDQRPATGKSSDDCVCFRGYLLGLRYGSAQTQQQSPKRTLSSILGPYSNYIRGLLLYLG